MKEKLVCLEEALAPVASGCTVSLGGNLLRRQPNASVRQLIRRGVKDLTVIGWAMTTALDLLAAAGAVRRFEGVYTGMFDHGLAPNVRRGVEEQRIEPRDFSESAMVARFRAEAQGLPFLPVRALIGTDMARYNPDQIRELRCPFTHELLHAVAAATSDFTIIHGYVGDRFGNVQLPLVRDTDDIDQLIASAARHLIVTVERIIPHDVVQLHPQLTYIPGVWVDAIVEAPYGAHPVACDTFYDVDESHLNDYLSASATQQGAHEYLQTYVTRIGSHDAYLAKLRETTSLELLDVRTSSGL